VIGGDEKPLWCDDKPGAAAVPAGM